MTKEQAEKLARITEISEGMTERQMQAAMVKAAVTLLLDAVAEAVVVRKYAAPVRFEADSGKPIVPARDALFTMLDAILAMGDDA